MNLFKKTVHLSEILEESENKPVIIFKYSSTCGSSDILKEKIEKSIIEKTINHPVYIVVVQEMPVISKNIEEFFNIKHESPQIIILRKGKVIYSESHNNIKIENFVYNSPVLI